MTGWLFQPFKTGCLVLACKNCATDWRLSGAELCGIRQVATRLASWWLGRIMAQGEGEPGSFVAEGVNLI